MYKTIYIPQTGALCRVRQEHEPREVNRRAAQLLLNGDLDAHMAEMVANYQKTGWPRRDKQCQRKDIWIRKECVPRIAEISTMHGVSMLRAVLVWMEATATHLLGSSAQSTKTTATAEKLLAKPVIDQPAAQVVRPVQPVHIEVPTSRIVEGRTQRLFVCPRHLDMTPAQISEVFGHGGLWIEEAQYDYAIAHKLGISEVLSLLKQNTQWAPSPAPSSNVIAMPITAPAAQAAAPSAPKESGGFDFASFMDSATTMFGGDERLAA